jgi:hypothetical protein
VSAIDDALEGIEGAPDAPPPDVCRALLEELARAIELGGATRFVRPPVAVADAFPDPWTPTPFGVGIVLLRLFAHADLALDVRMQVVREERELASRLTDRGVYVRPVDVQGEVATFEVGSPAGMVPVLEAVGGAALRSFAGASPYRGEAQSVDQRRGAIASAYLGFGVLAANAALMRDRGGGWGSFR